MPLLNEPVESSLESLQADKRAYFKTLSIRKAFRSPNLIASLSFAFEGLAYAAQTQRNFRIHLVLGALALSMAFMFQVSLIEWAMLWGIIGIVLFAELINTALEIFVDLLTDGHYDERAKQIKDMAAGAVLITALSALACGVCIFIPHLALLIRQLFPSALMA
jgi:diacylglycerol kinase (ATP)